jgi:hypothetical protein
MDDLKAIEIKAFVPARDFAFSKQFYEDLGFTVAWSDSDLAYLHCGDCSFLLQNFYQPEHAGNFMMHMLVPDVEAWWAARRKLPASHKVWCARRTTRGSSLGFARLSDCRPDRRAVAHWAKHMMKVVVGG